MQRDSDPWLPDRMVWTVSSLRMFRRCKRKFLFKYIHRLSPKTVGAPLVIGRYFHKGLEKWYSSKRASMTKISRATCKEFYSHVTRSSEYYDQDELNKLIVGCDNLGGMLDGYGRIYQRDRNDWRTTRDLVEKRFKIDFGSFDFAGRVDLILQHRSSGEFVIADTKTVSRIREEQINRVPVDCQIRGYALGVTKGLNISIKRGIYSMVAKSKFRRKQGESLDELCERVAEDYMAKPGKYFHREVLKVNMADIRRFATELIDTHEEFMWLLSRIRKGKQPTDLDWWPPTDTACDDFFRNCEYLPFCSRQIEIKEKSLFYTVRPVNEFHKELEDENASDRKEGKGKASNSRSSNKPDRKKRGRVSNRRRRSQTRVNPKSAS